MFNKIQDSQLSNKINKFFKFLKRYQVVLFIVAVALLYSVVIIRINNLNNAEPTGTSVSSNIRSITLSRVDRTAVNKLKQLQNNSVSVKALFDQARNNPFWE